MSSKMASVIRLIVSRELSVVSPLTALLPSGGVAPRGAVAIEASPGVAGRRPWR
jgi:hypothetical protein